MSIIKRFFERLFGRGEVTYPFQPLLAQMRAKDPDLFRVVGPLAVHDAVAIWRKKYPEDFVQ